MPRTWRFSPHDAARVRRFAETVGISSLVAQVLIARGVDDPVEAKSFLSGTLHDLLPPEDLPGVPEAVDRITAALKAGRRITIYGDYDVDGVTATSLLWHCLKLLGGTVDWYIPCRMEEGYGLNSKALIKLHADDSKRLVISVDCGVCSVAEAAVARDLGLELIITDHHRSGEQLPAAVIVHPALPQSEYPFPHLCGVGVAFKLAWAVCKQMHDGSTAAPRMREFLTDAVALASLGTIADVVPLRGENRLLVRYGLRALSSRAGHGLKALLGMADVAPGTVPDAEAIAFRVAPRINAAGRLGQASLAVELLTTEQPERAIKLADYLTQLNKDRQQLERRMVKEAKEIVAAHPAWDADPVLVISHPDWHPGVVGIVASRLVEHYEKPVVLIAEDRTKQQGQGSARSFGGFDLHAGLSACAQHLISFGGHRAAAGVRVSSGKIDDLRLTLNQYAADWTAEDAAYELEVDAEIRFSDLTPASLAEIDRLGPFGAGNRRPGFVATQVELAGPARTMGEGDRHLTCNFKQHGCTMRAVAFGKGEWAAELNAAPSPLSLYFTAEINRWNGNARVELRLIDWQSTKQLQAVGSPRVVTS